MQQQRRYTAAKQIPMHSLSSRSGVARHRVQAATSSRRGSRLAMARLPVSCRSSTSSNTTNSTTAADSAARTATVQVDLGYAAEQVTCKLTQPNSRLAEATMQFPLGLVLENVDGEVVVTEVNEGSAAADADCRVGDVVRATTAFTMQMTYPTMQLMFGGGGTPRMMKVLIAADRIPFNKVMDAVRSNTRDQGGDGSVTLVLERVDNSSSSDGGSGSDGGSRAGSAQQGAGGMVVVGEGGEGADAAVFDPRIFNSTFE